MKRGGFFIIAGCALLLLSPAWARASRHYKVLDGPQQFYYGHISYTEAQAEGANPVVLREGRAAPETAILNLPLGPGDVIRTPGDRRCEIQFDSGTIVRLDFDTELKIGTILAQSLSATDRLSNLELNRGRIYVMYKEYDSREMFQVLTASAAVKLSHKTVATISVAADGSTEAQVKSGKASLMFGPEEKSLKKETVRKMEGVTVRGLQAQREPYAADTDFEQWNERINAHFAELHQGMNALPKPVQNLPDAVFYFAQTYGNMYGEWIWDSLYGYVWRPYLDRMDYPGWRPYYVGSWSYANGQLYWVPDEPWGWIPYHLGIWQWDEKLGWVWLPGSLFAPAWADWEFFYGYAGWRPWSLYDWFSGFYTDFIWGGDWSFTVPGMYEGGLGPGRAQKPLLTSVGKNQLKAPDASAFPVPKELKAVSERMLQAYKAGDPRVLRSMKQVPSQTVFVSRVDLNKPGVQNRAVSWEKISKTAAAPLSSGERGALRRPADARKLAAGVYRGSEFVGQLARRVPSSAPPQRATQVPAGARTAGAAPARPATHPAFLDWNPDVKVARQMGVRIEYSSARNEVRCPELRLSSADRTRSGAFSSPRMTSEGVSYGSGPSEGSGGSSDGGRGSVSSGSASGSGARSSGSGSSGGSSGGGKIKN
jgi:tRNA(Leu) C34 or U34 (ribose-2'-O)-methylase TrmL